MVDSAGPPPFTAAATLYLAGRQRVATTVDLAGTPEAFASIRVAQSVMYLHTELAARRLCDIWRNAGVEALQLPARRRSHQRALPDHNTAEPSLVTHTRGCPPATVQLQRDAAGAVTGLAIRIGTVAFMLYDQLAFADCRSAFAQAAQLAHQLPAADLRRAAPATRSSEEARLAGAAAQVAARAMPAAVELREASAAVVGPLTELLAILRATAGPAARTSSDPTPTAPTPTAPPPSGPSGHLAGSSMQRPPSRPDHSPPAPRRR
jgi:hypothetical protein